MRLLFKKKKRRRRDFFVPSGNFRRHHVLVHIQTFRQRQWRTVNIKRTMVNSKWSWTWIISATAGRLVMIFCTNIHEWQTFFKTEMHYPVMERKEQGLDEEKQTFPGCIHYHVGNVNTCIYVFLYTLSFRYATQCCIMTPFQHKSPHTFVTFLISWLLLPLYTLEVLGVISW